MVHIIHGDGSIAICGVKFPDKISYLIFEVTCPECLRLHRLEVAEDKKRAEQSLDGVHSG